MQRIDRQALAARLAALWHTEFAQQVTVLAVTALMAMLSPAGLLVLLLFGGYRRTLGSALERAMEERTAWFWLLCLGPAVSIAVAHPSPPDDLLRNLHAWAVGFNYKSMYWGSPGIQAGDYYLGFDWTIGWIDRSARALGVADWSWLPVILADALGWGVALTLVLRRQVVAAGTRAWMVFIAVTLLVWLVPNFTARVLSGRPESFFALWAFCALAAEDLAGVVIWVLAGMLLSTWYWFFWIYTPAAVLLLAPRGWERRALVLRAAAAGSVLVVGMTFWFIASKGHYIGWFLHLREALHNRIASVGENEGLIMGLATPPVAVLMAFGLTAAAVKTSVGASARYTLVMLALLAAWFALPNMTRYTDSVVSLVAAGVVLLAARKWPADTLDGPWKTGAAVGIIGGFLWAVLILGTGSRPLENLALPQASPGQKVLTWFSRSTYDAGYLNPTLRIAPSFEVGFSPRDVQQQSLNLGLGKVDCDWLARHDVTWVIAPAAPIDAAQWQRCLSLVKTDNDGTSVWRLLPQTVPSR
jgi:hypothetical protein